MYQTGHNATANIGTYNDVQGNQTINTGLSQEQEDIAAILRLKIAENPGGNQHQTCTANTRVQIRQDIHEWAQDASTTNQIFWLVDCAGTGKSTVAKQVAEDWKSEGKAVVSFVFSITAADTKSNAKFCQTIAAKLADLRNFRSFRSTLAEALKQNLTLETLNFTDKFEELLRGPLKKTNQPVLIVIDALDECDKRDRSELLSVLLSKLQELSMVKVLITSRPERDIVERLRDHELVRSSTLQGSGGTDMTTEDIQRYVSSMFANSKKLQSLQPDAPELTNKANGTFIYASTACKFLENSFDPKASLKRLDHIRGLDDLYSQIMERAIPEDDPDSLQDVSSILQTIIAAQRPLSISEIQTLLKKGQVVQSVVNILASVLINGAEDSPVEILHPTFQEYLTDRSRSGVYFVDVKVGHKSLAIGCFDIWGTKPAAFPKEASDAIAPTLKYAVLSWPVHAAAAIKGTNDQDDISSLENLLLSFFKKELIDWFEWIVLLEAVYQSIKNLATLESRALVTSATATDPKNRASECRRWYRDSQRFLQHHQSGIEQGYKHVRGAISFTPKESLIYKAYFGRFSQEIPLVLCGMPTEWPSHQTLSGHTNGVSSVAFSSDGTYIVSGSYDKTLRLWDGMTGAGIGGPMKGHTDRVECVAFSPDENRIVSASRDFTLRLWDAVTGAGIGGPMKGHTDSVECAAFSPDGTRIVSGSRDKTLRLWDGVTGASIGGPMKGHSGLVRSVAFSPDGTRVISCSDDETLRLWNGVTGASIGEAMKGHTSAVSSVAFSPDGTHIVSGSWDRTLRLWDGATGASIGQPMRGHTDDILCVAFSPDGSCIVSGSDDKTLRLWDSTTGASIGRPMSGHTQPVTSVAFSPDGARVVSGSEDSTLRLRDDLAGVRICKPTDVQISRIFCVAFSPDGARIVSGSEDGTLQLWDGMTGACIGGSMKGHSDAVESVAFWPDGTRIVSGSFDDTLRLWHGVTGVRIGGAMRVHNYWAESVEFSPDGTRVLSNSYGDTFELWRVSSFAQLAPLRLLHVSPLTQMAAISCMGDEDPAKFSACGSYIYTSHRTWDIRLRSPSLVTGINAEFLVRSSFPVRYNKESRMLELHTSSPSSFPVYDCDVYSWAAHEGRIALALKDGRMVIIDCTHLL